MQEFEGRISLEDARQKIILPVDHKPQTILGDTNSIEGEELTVQKL